MSLTTPLPGKPVLAVTMGDPAGVGPEITVRAVLDFEARRFCRQSSSVTVPCVTLGLPIMRTRVDHGTAFDVAGTGTASAVSMIEALRVGARYAGDTAFGAPRRQPNAP